MYLIKNTVKKIQFLTQINSVSPLASEDGLL